MGQSLCCLVETERLARALKKKDVKKVQPVWLQVEQKREPVWTVEFVSEFVSMEVLHNFDAGAFIFVATYVEAPQVQRCQACHGFRG